MTSLLASPIESEPGVGYFMFGFVGLQQTIDDYERIASFSSWPRGRATKTGTPFVKSLEHPSAIRTQVDDSYNYSGA